MGLSSATLFDPSLGYNAHIESNIYDWSPSYLDINAPFDCIDTTSESTTSPCFGSLPWSDETSYSTEEWTSNAGELWPEKDDSQFRQSSHLVRFDRFSSLREPEDSKDFEINYRNPSKPRPYDCGWLGCSKADSLSNVEDWKLHMKDHGRTARDCWKPSESCCWHGCPSKARFKTAKNFEDHLNNIHINPLLCTYEGCRHRTPFRGKADLQRHINSVHIEGTKSKCPYPSCRSERRNFSRKDKLILHLREVHDTDRCPFAHCVADLDPRTDSTAKHIAKLHGEFECALGSCEDFVSSFCENGLLEHLQLDHHLDWQTVLRARDMAQNVGKKTLRTEHLLGAEISGCRTCHQNPVE